MSGFATQAHSEAGSADHWKEKRAEVFKPPYNPNLYVRARSCRMRNRVPDTSS